TNKPHLQFRSIFIHDLVSTYFLVDTSCLRALRLKRRTEIRAYNARTVESIKSGLPTRLQSLSKLIRGATSPAS
ncbi:hypothetical protein, partial [Rhizobium sp. P28RR-XV]|uniref:hypothetical protein n=1 Tax=Rhizobium sp. P28RR-XV TaxID=2726737 RepID=UPI0019812943